MCVCVCLDLFCSRIVRFLSMFHFSIEISNAQTKLRRNNGPT